MSEVATFLEQNGLSVYACIMDDQGFEELADLIALLEDEASFKDLVPALGHRTKIRRLLGAASQPATTPQSISTPVVANPFVATASLPPVDAPVTSALVGLRKTPLVAWLNDNQLEIYAESLQRAGYDNTADLTELLKTPELLEHLIPVVGHRDRVRRLLGGTGSARGSILAEQWLGGIKSPGPGPDPELASSQGGGLAENNSPGFLGETDAVTKLLSAVSSNFIARGKGVSPPAQGSYEEHDESSQTSSSHDDGGRFATVPASGNQKRVASNSAAPANSNANTVTVGDGTYGFDTALFVDNEGLDNARRHGNGILCKKNNCGVNRCRDLHFRDVSVKHEHMRRNVSCSYVSQVTLGLLTAIRKDDRVVPCMDDNCNSTSCPNAHIGFPLRREVSHDGGAIVELGNHSVPLRDVSFTDALMRLIERPVTEQDRKFLQNGRVCPAFALSQTCIKGVRCWNYHVLPSGFSRYFWKSFPLDRLNRHLNSLHHLHSEHYNVGLRMERTGRRSFEVGEALDLMVHTSCRPCALIFFEAFRSATRRQGSDLFWALLYRMHAHQGREDATMNELMVSANNTLQLRHSETLSTSTPIGQLVTRMTEAIVQNLKKSAVHASRSFVGDTGKATMNAFVYWDFDNILFAERNDLTLFYQCLLMYVTREGYASNKSAVHVKAFGTQHSFATETVDALRDMQVEMVLCSSKKQEETDRQMERSMRSIEGRPDATAIILSSDKDFASIAKELTRTGVHVVIIHCAEESSNHDSMLQMNSSESHHIFEVYASALTSKAPAKRFRAPPPAPPTHQANHHQPNHNHHYDPQQSRVSPPSRSSVLSDPAILASHGAAPPVDAVSSSSVQNIMSFFKQSPAPSRGASESATDVSRIEEEILAKSRAGCTIPQPRSAKAASVAKESSGEGGMSVATIFSKLSGVRTASPPPTPTVVLLTSLAQAPVPPKDHRSWYALVVDAYLVRLQDRQRAGDLRGPYNPSASEESARREMKIYMEMAGMVKGFLPDWFRHDAALRMMYHKIMDDSPDDWMNNEHYLSTYDASQFVEVFAVLRYIAAVVEGPLAGHEDCCTPPTAALRLRRSS